MKPLATWIIRIASALILLNGLFWTWFGIACAWPSPAGMLMHILIPGLPMLALGLVCWKWPIAGGAPLAFWGASPLLIFFGSRPFFNYPGHWLSLTPLLVYGLPLLMGLLLISAGMAQKRITRNA